jgi:phage-related protein
MDTFPSYAPDWKPKTTSKARVLKSNFGDGYVQRAGDGLNPIDTSISLTWSNLSIGDADDIIEFLEEKAGVEAFYFTPRGSATALKWVCEEWTRSEVDPSSDSISATFIRVFDL